MAEYCQVCGKPAEDEAFLEGARVWLCGKCLRFGKAVAKPRPVPAAHAAVGPARFGEVGVVDGFGGIIRKAREGRRISLPDLAKKIFVNEKELAKIEREELTPAEGVARKLERELGIKLLQTE